MSINATADTSSQTALLSLNDSGHVRADILYLVIRDGRVQPGKQMPYVPYPDDEIVDSDTETVWVKRKGCIVGTLVGRERRILYALDRIFKSDCDPHLLEQPQAFRITSVDDVRYADGLTPTTVARKSKPYRLARRRPEYIYEAALEHTLYLKLPHPLQTGCSYTVTHADDRLPVHTFVFEPRQRYSESVHVSQVGFHPADPLKLGFLSCWMGAEGGVDYDLPRAFHLVEHLSGDIVASGPVEVAKAAEVPELNDGRNLNGATVYRLNFSAFNRPGRYHLYVEGVGCSYPFSIDCDVWQAAFAVSVKGFYHQRSGIELGPPYTDFVRPLCFHVDNGIVIRESATPIYETRNGGFAHNTSPSNFNDLIAGDTGRIFPTVAGGYMDAGDWDRKTSHLRVTRLLLELYEHFPAFFDHLKWNIPADYPDLPDLLNEALFELDFFSRLQTEQGAVRGGIESAAHPRHGECSWQESLMVYVYAPDVWTSYIYAGVAARAARILRPLDHALADQYHHRAQQAVNWSESTVDTVPPYPEIAQARNLAAIELYHLTGEPCWHQLFLDTIDEQQLGTTLQDAAWVYLNCTQHPRDAAVVERCSKALCDSADMYAAFGRQTAFGWTQHPDRFIGQGTFTAPDAINLVRAHKLTGKAAYFVAIVRACQSGVGANPVNMCYTTGLGQRSPQRPLHVDMLISNQPPPPGLTVYGPLDALGRWGEKQEQDIAAFIYPPVRQWPLAEAFWDIYWYPAVCEYTVQQTMASNAYVWGYIAGYRASQQPDTDRSV